MNNAVRFLGKAWIVALVGLLLSAVTLSAWALFDSETALASNDSGPGYTYNGIGNSGAVIEVSAQTVTAVVDDSDLATVSVEGNVVTVTGAAEAAGVARVTIVADGASFDVEVPLGFTTFSLDSNTVTVSDGTNREYEIVGLKADGTEIAQSKLTQGKTAEGDTFFQSEDGVELQIAIKKKGGTYVFQGTSSCASIAVKKEATKPATLLFADLDLASQITSPITIKKGSTTTVSLQALAGHTASLSDVAFNNADVYGPKEDGGNGKNQLAESAVIKGKTAANVTLCGEGTFNLVCNTKNAVKIGESGALTIKDVTLNVVSKKHGLSSDNTLTILSGTIDVESAADGIRCNPDAVNATTAAARLSILGGNVYVSAGDDGIKSDADLIIGEEGGTNDSLLVKISKSYEGLEGKHIYVNAGTLDITSSDDGVNASDPDNYLGDDPARRDGSTSSSETFMTFTGGYTVVNANADGLDANGAMYLRGGTIVIWANNEGIDDPLDADTTMIIDGATVLACGSSFHPGYPSAGSQPYVSKIVRGGSISAGSVVSGMCDAVKTFSAVAPKSITHVLYSDPNMKSGGTWSTSYVDTPGDVAYSAHVENIGWQRMVSDGANAGTSGKSYRLEAFTISTDLEGVSVEYRGHVQNIGWQNYVCDGEQAGTSGKSLRVEAMQVRLTGPNADNYDVFYRVHAQNIGWMGWASNDEKAGTEGYCYRLEAMQIVIVPKGESAPESASDVSYAFLSKQDGPSSGTIDGLSYNVHVQDIGWQNWRSIGAMAGTTGKSYRLEAIHIKSGIEGLGVEYETHVQNIGWQGVKHDGQMSGTSGKSYRLEGIRVRLTGEQADNYDVYYRVHAQNIGWMGWAKNGENAGTSGRSYRLEGIQIVLVKKGEDAPGPTYNGITSKTSKAFSGA